MQRRYLFVVSAVYALTLAVTAGPAWSQAYPNKVIKLQVPFAPGGTTDIVGRVIAEPLGKALGQTVIIRSEEHTSELQSLMRISYAVFCLKKKTYPHHYT